MNDLVRIDTMNLTMSSLEIAELTGKEHKHVTRDIRTMLVGLYGDEYVAQIIPEHRRNRQSEFVRENADLILSAICGDGPNGNHQDQRGFAWERDERGYVSKFILDKSHSMTLVSGYVLKLRKKIMDRWMELEESSKPAPVADLSDPVQLRGILLGYTEKVIALENKVAEQAPKVEALDRIATSSIGSMCITDAAKHIQVAPAVLFRWLAEHKWIYRRNGTNWIGYQDRIHEGLVEHKVTTIQMKETATSPAKEIISEQLRITAKGLAKLATVFSGQPRPRQKIGIVGMMRTQARIAIAEFKDADFVIWDYDSPQEKLSATSHCDIVFVHTAHCAHTTEFKLDSIKANWVKVYGGVTSLRDAVARYLAE